MGFEQLKKAAKESCVTKLKRNEQYYGYKTQKYILIEFW